MSLYGRAARAARQRADSVLRLYLLQGLLATMWAASPAQVFAQSEQFVRASQRVEIAAHVSEASQQFGIPEQWIYAVIRAESAGRVRVVSRAGAMGLMQLMAGTWARQRARFSLGQDPFDPRDNILAGTSYLREMYDRYGAQGFLAAGLRRCCSPSACLQRRLYKPGMFRSASSSLTAQRDKNWTRWQRPGPQRTPLHDRNNPHTIFSRPSRRLPPNESEPRTFAQPCVHWRKRA